MGVGLGGMLTVGTTTGVGKGTAITGNGGEVIVCGVATAHPSICAIWEYAYKIGESKVREAWLRDGGLALSKCSISSAFCFK